jgi:peroxiredoxin Q/BCP
VEKNCAEDYGVLRKFMMMTMAKRESFIINPEGKILKRYRKVDPDTHTNQVLEDLKKFKDAI